MYCLGPFCFALTKFARSFSCFQPISVSYAKVAVDELFPFLPPGSQFLGHRIAQFAVAGIDGERRRFVGLLPGSARIYALTLLCLPFRCPYRVRVHRRRRNRVYRGGHCGDRHRSRRAVARVDKKERETRDDKEREEGKEDEEGEHVWRKTHFFDVDFRDADPRVLARAVSSAGFDKGVDADALFAALVNCRAELGSDVDGRHFFLPVVPAPPDIPTTIVTLEGGDLGVNVQPCAAFVGKENWQIEFPLYNSHKKVTKDFSSLAFWLRGDSWQLHKVAELMSNVFPVAYRQYPKELALFLRAYAWRMRWKYAVSRLSFCHGTDCNGNIVFSATCLRPWY